jgi:hypothetical protein
MCSLKEEKEHKSVMIKRKVNFLFVSKAILCFLKRLEF